MIRVYLRRKKSKYIVTTMKLFSCNKPSWESIQKNIENRRVTLENARNMNLRRLHGDLERISKREIEYAQKLVEELVPVKISWNDDAWKRLQEFVPIKVEVTTEVEKEAVQEKSMSIVEENKPSV